MAPIIVQEIVGRDAQAQGGGACDLLVEQNLRAALDLADRHYVLAKGEACFVGTTSELENNAAVLSAHLSV